MIEQPGRTQNHEIGFEISRYADLFGSPTQRAATVLDVKAIAVFYSVGTGK
jgi:hypothetical protein